jgi:branched-chain amino acid transport system substrate-binding protein
MKESKPSEMKLSRRSLLKYGASAVGAVAFMGPWKFNRVYAAATDKPITIGLTSDASGLYAANGQMDRFGQFMAIDEFNEKGGVLGRKVKYIHQDTETTPATGSRVAEKLITRDNVDFLMGATSSSVANAISQIAQKYGTIYFNTNSSSPTESGKNCHRTKFTMDADAVEFANGMTVAAMKKYGKKWMMFTSDYVWGHMATDAVTRIGKPIGLTVMDNLIAPIGTRDFSSFLLKVQQNKPDVVSVAIGGDDLQVLKAQIDDLGMKRSCAWAYGGNDWVDLQEGFFGTLSQIWYWKLDLPGVAEFVQKYRTKYPNAKITSPGNACYNGYQAVKTLLNAVERAGTTNNIAVIKQLEGHKISALERMQHHDAWIDPDNHHMQQTMYLLEENPNPAHKDDIFKIVGMASPEEVRNVDTPTECRGAMESYEDTPVYEI